MKSFYLCLLLVLTLNAPVQADSAGISKQQAVDIAQQVHPGRVLSVKQKGGVYKVKTLSASGEVRIVTVNAKSGKVKGR